MPKPTMNQKRAFAEIVKKIKAGEKVDLGEAMRKAGYSISSSKQPSRALTNTKGFKSLLSKIDDEKLLDKLREIALDDGDNRNSISAIKEIFTLKNRYPEKGLKISLLKDQLSELDDVNEENN